MSLAMFGRARTSTAVSRRHKPDMLLLLFVGVLVLLGLIVIYAISPALAARTAGQDQNAYMYRQLINLGVAFAAFAVTALVPLEFWRKYQGRMLAAAMVLGVMPFLLQSTPIGWCANGACRWLDVGTFNFQPSEFMKFALIIFLANFLAVRMQQGRVDDRNQTLAPIGMVLLAMALIVIGLQKDLGTGLTIFGITITVLFFAKLSSKWMLTILGALVGLSVIFTILTPGRVERILTFVNHSSVTTDAMGYHINQALIAVGSGGLVGKGLGQGIQAFGYLPEAANDSIFAILAEKFGFLGTVAVLAIFTGLFVRILKVIDYSVDPFYRLVAAGAFGWIVTHTVINIGAMLGIIPLTGITLPFVSLGGTSLMFILAALGLVFQISRYTSHTNQTDNQLVGGYNDHSERRRGFGRSRNTGFSRTA